MLLYDRMMHGQTGDIDEFGDLCDKLIRHWAPSNRAQRRAQKKR
jgi:hypothetical protein